MNYFWFIFLVLVISGVQQYVGFELAVLMALVMILGILFGIDVTLNKILKDLHKIKDSKKNKGPKNL